MLYSIQIAMAFAFLSSLFGDFMQVGSPTLCFPLSFNRCSEQAVGASVRIFGLLDLEPSIDIRGGLAPKGSEPILALKDVTFRYPARPDTVVLDKVCSTQHVLQSQP
jgi:ABC-type multidrug transport system fused ATPase/permease subunit